MNRAFPFLFAATLFGLFSTGCDAPALGARDDSSRRKNTFSEECTDLPPGALTSDGVRCPDPSKELDAGAPKKDESEESDGGIQRSGITTCQPAFEKACKPAIVFTNEDPTNRGKVFTDAIPDVEKAEQEIACVACSILYRTPDEVPNLPTQIKLILDTHGGVAQAALNGDQIQFDLDYIGSFKDKAPDEVKREMLGVLQHETVHLYQHYGTGGTGEGVADLVRARTGYYSADRWRVGEGTWKDAYTASGNFYSWLTGPCSFHSTFYADSDPDFPYKLNKVLAGTDGDRAFDAAANLIKSRFGRTPEDLWDEYQRTAFPQTAAMSSH